ncbi:deaminase domain-containing protein [Lacrimispora amygdalina]|uniref:deaminase domain-containing protein n=1 Tax=Lacrimispora amygdalina TaxID=253257 RepID=UPI000BE48062|nr:deaminase domain-containing protein [Lacrimispora amygdalina]
MPNNPLKNKGNMAAAEVDIPGIKKEFSAHSKINSSLDKGADISDFSLLKPEGDRLFKTYEPAASTLTGTPFDRFHDTEAKILEDIASQITDPNISGTIDLFTELPACQSCTNIIFEFKRKFPNIILNILTKD